MMDGELVHESLLREMAMRVKHYKSKDLENLAPMKQSKFDGANRHKDRSQ